MCYTKALETCISMQVVCCHLAVTFYLSISEVPGCIYTKNIENIDKPHKQMCLNANSNGTEFYWLFEY